MLAGVLDHLDADLVTDLRHLDLVVLDLHRVELLGEVGGVAEEVDRVADVELAVGELDRGDVRLAEVMRDGANEFFHDWSPVPSERSIYSQATLAVHLAKNFNLMSNLEGEHALSKLKEPLQKVELRRLLVNLADDFQPLAWDRDIDIVVEKTEFDDGPPVLAMKPLISQAFSNIIENAVKYSDHGSSIVVQGKHKPASGSFSVSIRNRGIPLPPTDTEQVFARGFRSKEARKRPPTL